MLKAIRSLLGFLREEDEEDASDEEEEEERRDLYAFEIEQHNITHSGIRVREMRRLTCSEFAEFSEKFIEYIRTQNLLEGFSNVDSLKEYLSLNLKYEQKQVLLQQIEEETLEPHRFAYYLELAYTAPNAFLEGSLAAFFTAITSSKLSDSNLLAKSVGVSVGLIWLFCRLKYNSIQILKPSNNAKALLPGYEAILNKADPKTKTVTGNSQYGTSAYP